MTVPALSPGEVVVVTAGLPRRAGRPAAVVAAVAASGQVQVDVLQPGMSTPRRATVAPECIDRVRLRCGLPLGLQE